VIFRFRLEPEPRVEYISEATSRLLGYAPEEFYAEPELALTVVHPDDRERVLQMVRSGDTTPTIVRYVRKDGSIAWAQVKLNPFYAGDGEEEIVGVDGVVREVANPAVDPAKGVLVAAGIRIDVVDRAVSVDGRAVRLTPAEFKLLILLSEQPGRTVSRDEMMRHLWRSDHTGDGHTCEAHISNLRKKIESDPRNPTRIVTVRGKGYRLVG
jgi:PAS domain S-box-containing protein